jgi:hypothetical protein
MSKDMLPHPSRDLAGLAVVLVFFLALLSERLWATDDGQSIRQHCGASSTGKRFNRTELLLGLSKRDGSTVTDAEFQHFIDMEVTPRLPDGFTVVAGSGQFKDSRGVIVRESARMLVVLYPLSDRRSSQGIDEIRASYKDKHQQDSVARIDGESCASF